jgi:hypothetical protein
MHKHVFSIAVIVFVVGAAIVPAPPPAAALSHIQDMLASPFKSLPPTTRSFSEARNVSPAE